MYIHLCTGFMFCVFWLRTRYIYFLFLLRPELAPPSRSANKQIALGGWRQQVQGWSLYLRLLCDPLCGGRGLFRRTASKPFDCLGGFKAAPRLGEVRVGYLGRPTARETMAATSYVVRRHVVGLVLALLLARVSAQVLALLWVLVSARV